MKRSSSWEVNSSSATKEIPELYTTLMFITVYTTTYQMCLTWVKQFQGRNLIQISIA
jgi:hypothetical protein